MICGAVAARVAPAGLRDLSKGAPPGLCLQVTDGVRAKEQQHSAGAWPPSLKCAWGSINKNILCSIKIEVWLA